MACPSIVRLATPADEECLMKLCKMLHEENGLFSLEEDMVRETLRKGFERTSGVIGVIGSPDALEGVIYMEVGNFWYSRKPHLMELFNFVHPDHRKSDHAKALLDFAKKCATDDIRLVIGIISNIRTAAKVKLYERKLGKPSGAFFVYPPRETAA
jgi:GNAT superfamily N-acetyltransferase